MHQYAQACACIMGFAETALNKICRNSGGPAVIKGIASLPDDMQATLAAALKGPAGTQ